MDFRAGTIHHPLLLYLFGAGLEVLLLLTTRSALGRDGGDERAGPGRGAHPSLVRIHPRIHPSPAQRHGGARLRSQDRRMESQNIPTQKGPTGISESSSWPCTGHSNNPTLCSCPDQRLPPMSTSIPLHLPSKGRCLRAALVLSLIGEI